MSGPDAELSTTSVMLGDGGTIQCTPGVPCVHSQQKPRLLSWASAPVGASATDEILRRHNDIHDPLAMVPPEVAQDILEYAADPFPSRTEENSHDYDRHDYRINSTETIHGILETNFMRAMYPLELSAVSRRWRQLAFSNPKLWDIVIMRRKSKDWTLPHSLVEQWLARSGGRPLTVVLSWNLYAPDPTDPIPTDVTEGELPAIIKTICAHSHHWRNLIIQLLPRLIPHFRCEREATQDLDFFLLDCFADEQNHEVQFNLDRTFIRAKHATILAAPVVANFSWASLRRLDLVGTSAYKILRIFEQTPQLEELSGMIYSRGDEGEALALAPITLPKLADIGMTITEQQADVLFRKLRAPALKSLALTSMDNLLATHLMWVPIQALTAFVLESNMRLKEFSISSCAVHEHHLMSLLEILSDLEKLRIHDAGLEDVFDEFGDFAITLTDVFLVHLVSSISPDRPVGFLPKLRSLHYRGPQEFSWESWADVFYAHSHLDVNNPHKRPLENISVHLVPEPDTPDFDILENLISGETLKRFYDLPVDWVQVKLDQSLLDGSCYHSDLKGELNANHFFRNYHTHPELLESGQH